MKRQALRVLSSALLLVYASSILVLPSAEAAGFDRVPVAAPIHIASNLNHTPYDVKLRQSDGQTRTVSKNAFISDWDGRVQTDATSAQHASRMESASQANPVPGYRKLSDQEARWRQTTNIHSGY